MGSRPAGQGGRGDQEGVISMSAIGEQAALLQHEWRTDPRWAGIRRDYRAQDVVRLRDGIAVEHRLAGSGARRLWSLLHSRDAVETFGMAGGDYAGELAGAGVVADASGAPDAFELMTAMIEAGAAGALFEDHLPADEWRGHPGGKALVPTGQHTGRLAAARLAADVLGVPSLVIARTGALAASVLTSDTDERDHEFLTGERTANGFWRVQPGLYACGTRALAFAPYADMLWLETPEPDLAAARAFACVIRSQYPDKLLAYSCAPTFNWRAHLDDGSAARFLKELAGIGYRFQAASPARFHAPDQTPDCRAGQPGPAGMPACVKQREEELVLLPSGYTAARS
jgi:isocitrate lyase